MSFRPPDPAPPEIISLEPHTIEIWCSRRGDHFALSFVDEGLRKVFKTADRSLVVLGIRKLVAAADAFTECVKNWTANTPDALRRGDLEPLAAAGDALGALLLPDGQAPRFLAKLRSLKPQQVLIIAIDDKELNFPWNLVRVAGGGGWLGEIACFGLSREGEGGLRGFASGRDVGGVLAGYADDDELMSGRRSATHPDATEAELRALERITGPQVHLLDDLPLGPLDPWGVGRMQEWLSRPLHLFHFNCHAADFEDPEGFTHVGLRMGAYASGRDVADDMAMTGAVVLDVCSAAQGREGYWDNCFSACLHKRGVPAVCASSCTVTDEFGLRFSEELYKQIPLSDYRLLPAILAAQKALLGETGHPMALYYTFEGSPRFEVGGY